MNFYFSWRMVSDFLINSIEAREYNLNDWNPLKWVLGFDLPCGQFWVNVPCWLKRDLCILVGCSFLYKSAILISLSYMFHMLMISFSFVYFYQLLREVSKVSHPTMIMDLSVFNYEELYIILFLLYIWWCYIIGYMHI